MISIASAKPRKRFFVDMFTRDISLQDCILDLVDNSIDAYIRKNSLDLESALSPRSPAPASIGNIELEISSTRVSIKDDCGGIEINKASKEVFNFGHSPDGISQLTDRGLGAYGIGLKRALFKIGDKFRVSSFTPSANFSVEQDLREWVKKDETIEDWAFPLQELDRPEGQADGTTIEISAIPDELQSVLGTNDFVEIIGREIGRAYALFLLKHIKIKVNGRPIAGLKIPLAEEFDGSQAASDEFLDKGVKIILKAGLAEFSDGRWTMDRAGWYILCNGRVVVTADKTELTGWGNGVLPQFHSSKSRGFVGIASFSSTEPTNLPWTTTKRGLNRESPTYLRARQKMQAIARPVYTYLDGLYNKKPEDEGFAPIAVKAAASAVPITGVTSSVFKPPRQRTKRTTTKVQYEAENRDIETIRKHIRQTMPANKIGRLTFDYYLEQEGLS